VAVGYGPPLSGAISRIGNTNRPSTAIAAIRKGAVATGEPYAFAAYCQAHSGRRSPLTGIERRMGCSMILDMGSLLCRGLMTPGAAL
jgi:hypothetical protein